MYLCTVRLPTRMPNLSSSPRIRSAPHFGSLAAPPLPALCAGTSTFLASSSEPNLSTSVLPGHSDDEANDFFNHSAAERIASHHRRRALRSRDSGLALVPRGSVSNHRVALEADLASVSHDELEILPQHGLCAGEGDQFDSRRDHLSEEATQRVAIPSPVIRVVRAREAVLARQIAAPRDFQAEEALQLGAASMASWRNGSRVARFGSLWRLRKVRLLRKRRREMAQVAGNTACTVPGAIHPGTRVNSRPRAKIPQSGTHQNCREVAQGGPDESPSVRTFGSSFRSGGDTRQPRFAAVADAQSLRFLPLPTSTRTEVTDRVRR